MGIRRPRSFWEGLLAEVHRGESIEAVARRHQVRPRTLQWWAWQLRREAGRGKPRAPRFLPVLVRQPSATSIEERPASDIAIVVADLRVHLHAGADVAYVSALVAALRRSC